MKVLHVYRTYFPDPPGGLQEAIRQICLSTQPLGVKNRVFTLSPSPLPETIKRYEAKVVRSKSWAAPASCDLGGIESLRKFSIQAKWADIIHFHFPWPFADILNLLVQSKKPKIMTYHSDIVRQRVLGKLYTPLMRHTLQDMDAVIATSPVYVETSPVLSKYVSPDHIKVIPLGINEESYPSECKGVTQKYNLAEREPFILFIGVLRYYKGLHVLLEAAANIKGKVVIAGSGPEESSLRSIVKRWKLNNVIFTGRVTDSEKVALLKSCKALVLPSHLRSEAYGMVLVEASMFSKPMITCEIGTGTSFVNKDNETGFVVAPENPIELAKAANKLLSDESLAKQFGHSARVRYEDIFSGEVMGKSYNDLYKDVLSK